MGLTHTFQDPILCVLMHYLQTMTLLFTATSCSLRQKKRNVLAILEVFLSMHIQFKCFRITSFPFSDVQLGWCIQVETHYKHYVFTFFISNIKKYNIGFSWFILFWNTINILNFFHQNYVTVLHFLHLSLICLLIFCKLWIIL